jgi:NADP-dependent 3-hydroxy acid dehydrogenase YdfG
MRSLNRAELWSTKARLSRRKEETGIKCNFLSPGAPKKRGLVRTWAEDLKGTCIRVSVLSPGATATELAKEALGEAGQKAFASMTPSTGLAQL